MVISLNVVSWTSVQEYLKTRNTPSSHKKTSKKRKAKWESTNEPNNPNKINIPVLQNCHCHYSRVGFPWFLPISSNQKSSFYYPIWSKIIKRVRKLISTWCWWGVWVWFWLERVLELETRVVKQQAKTLLIFIRTVKKFQGSLTKRGTNGPNSQSNIFWKKKKKHRVGFLSGFVETQ